MDYLIKPLTDEHLDEAFNLATKVFVAGSTLHRLLNVSLREYRDYLRQGFVGIVNENLSVVALKKDAGRIAGCMIVGDYHRQIFSTKSNHPKFAPLVEITGELRRKYLFENNLSPGEVALVDMGAVEPDFGGRGIYQAMRAHVQENARTAGYRYIAGELSSPETQHVILNKLRHRELSRVHIRSFQFAGAMPFEDATELENYVLAIGNL